MRCSKLLLLSLPLLTLAVVDARDASACGGCFTGEKENSQVAGHRMVLSIAPQQTTLWDQISYSGKPSSFAWVLPIKGPVEIGLSSDALFAALEQSTQVTVQSPPPDCPGPPPGCEVPGAFGGSSTATGGMSSGTGGNAAPGDGVTVIAQQVVGPYETVQLKATDPGALNAWLAKHKYAVPADVVPVIDAYQAEGFDFLALKLVPGQSVSAMKPVRITSMGASPVLPLRMVAAGTGAKTPVTLWVLGEGRYDTVTLPDFTIQASQLVWDWTTQSSNYAALRQQTFANSLGTSWLIEAGEPFSSMSLSQPLGFLAANDPSNSGYADANGQGAADACNADIAKLFAGIPDASLWITRLHAELSRPALVADLELGAALDQTPIPRSFIPASTTGAPPCPDYSYCAGIAGGAPGSDGSTPSSGSGCAVGGGEDPTPALMGWVALAGALLLSRRRNRRG